MGEQRESKVIPFPNNEGTPEGPPSEQPPKHLLERYPAQCWRWADSKPGWAGRWMPDPDAIKRYEDEVARRAGEMAEAAKETDADPEPEPEPTNFRDACIAHSRKTGKWPSAGYRAFYRQVGDWPAHPEEYRSWQREQLVPKLAVAIPMIVVVLGGLVFALLAA